MELPRACGLGARQKSPLQHFDPPDNTFHLYLPTITIGSALTCASSPVLVLARYHRERSILCEKRVCLVSASIGRSILENADSARRCRFRKSQQKRASDLDSIYGWIAKLPHKICAARKEIAPLSLPAARYPKSRPDHDCQTTHSPFRRVPLRPGRRHGPRRATRQRACPTRFLLRRRTKTTPHVYRQEGTGRLVLH